MTTINGTSGPDVINVPAPGDFEVFGGAGDDVITVRRTTSVGNVTIDGGDGNDSISVLVTGSQIVTAHGGAGNDVFDLQSGGTVYGDSGADTFRINGPGILQLPFTIGDFSAEDRIDLTPTLKALTRWVEGTDPFAAGLARVAQFGGDTILQEKMAGAETWWTLGVLKNVNATQLTAAQFGFTPKVEAVAFATLTTSKSTYMEGELVTIDVYSPDGGSLRAAVTVTMTSPLGSRSETYGVSFALGESHSLYTFRIYDDNVQGDGRYDITLTPTGTFSDPRVIAQSLSLTVKDDDFTDFSVYSPSAEATYKSFTRLDHIANADSIVFSNLNEHSASLSTRQWVHGVEQFALGTTSVALSTYQFFTGKTPTEAGIDYLVSPNGPNPNNLNSAYYQSFNVENRYINFAVNLGKVGEGKTAFAAAYGGLSLFEATRSAYATIFGTTPTDDKVHALIDTRTDYFASYGGDGTNGIGTKAAMVGWLLVEAMKADVGDYARAIDNFYMDLTDGSAHFNVNLVAVYGPGTFVDGIA